MTPKECITLLKEMKSIYFKFKKDKTHLLNNMKESVYKFHNGKEVYKQTADYVYADEFDKALKYFRKAVRTSRLWPLSKITYHDFGGITRVILGHAVLGIVLIILGLRLTRLAHESSDWPNTTGVITNSYFYEDSDEDGDVSYTPVTEYSYTIYGEEYQSDQRNIGGLTGFVYDWEADSIVKKYPKDSLVTVWYNPDKNKIAVLEPGFDDKFHFVFYMGIILLSFAFFMFITPFIIALVRILKEGKK